MLNKVKLIALVGLLSLTTMETKTINWKLIGALAGTGIAAIVVVRKLLLDRRPASRPARRGRRPRQMEPVAEPAGNRALEVDLSPDRIAEIQADALRIQADGIERGSTLLIHFIKNNMLEHALVLLSVERANPNETDENGWTPLIHAADKNNLPAINLLLSHNAEIDTIDSIEKAEIIRDYGTLIAITPLMLAATNGHIDSVIFLRERGASLTVQDSYGLNPLMWATMAGQPHVVDFLRQQPEIAETIDNTSRSGGTALVIAAINGRPECARLLCEARANPRIDNGNGKFPLEIAIEKMSTATNESDAERFRETAQVLETFS